MRVLHAGGLGILRIEFGHFDFAGEAEFRQDPDAPEVWVDLVPLEAMACGDGVGVVIIVPSFAAGEQGYPPVIAGVIAGFEAAATPEVGCGVDQPSGMEAEG